MVKCKHAVQALFTNSNPTIALDSNNKTHVVWANGPLGVNRDIFSPPHPLIP
ncbi:MAG: hypothetical protein ACFFCI_19225 [Promethearchaeota archaeon]